MQLPITILSHARTLFLAGLSLSLLAGTALADDWPQWLGEKRDGIWREKGILKKFPEGGPTLVWKRGIGAGYAGPAVSDGRVFVMSRHVDKGSKASGNAFSRGEIPGTETLSCLKESDGSVLWEKAYPATYTVSYPAGPRATPTVDGELVYTLGAEGALYCRKVADGSEVWSKSFGKEYHTKTPFWGYAGAPVVYGGLLICLAGGEGSTAVAFDKMTGKEVWKALTAKEPGYAPPTLIHHGGKDQLILWHPESVNSLDPKTGVPFWSVPWPLRSGLSVPTPKLEGDHLLLTCFYNGSLMMKLKPDQSEPEVLWKTEKASEKRTTHLHGIMSTPYIEKGYIYGVCSYGEFRCLEMSSGKRIWESMKPTSGDGRKARWFNVFLTPNEDRYFLFTERGDLLIAKLSPEGYEEIDRAHLIEPNGSDMRQRKIVWSHPAYANQNIYLRNDSEIRCYSLKAN